MSHKNPNISDRQLYHALQNICQSQPPENLARLLQEKVDRELRTSNRVFWGSCLMVILLILSIGYWFVIQKDTLQLAHTIYSILLSNYLIIFSVFIVALSQLLLGTIFKKEP